MESAADLGERLGMHSGRCFRDLILPLDVDVGAESRLATGLKILYDYSVKLSNTLLCSTQLSQISYEKVEQSSGGST